MRRACGTVARHKALGAMPIDYHECGMRRITCGGSDIIIVAVPKNFEYIYKPHTSDRRQCFVSHHAECVMVGLSL